MSRAPQACLAAMAVFFLLPFLATAQQQTNSLEDLRALYEQASAKITATADQRKKDALASYGRALSAALKAAQDEGDPDGYTAIKAEQKRFSADGTISVDPATLPAAASNAVVAYHAAVTSSDTNAFTQQLVLTRKYVGAIDALVKRLMREERIDKAKEAKEQKDAMAALLADMESKVATPGAPPSGGAGPQSVRPARPALVNVATRARVEASRSSSGIGGPEKIHDGVTDDVDKNFVSYWFAGEGNPRPDWVRLVFEKPAEVHSIRILVPIGPTRFPNSHEPWDYTVAGLNRAGKTILATVKAGKHPPMEPGPIPSVQWVVVELQKPKMLTGVQFTCEKTSGEGMGPVIFEIEVLATATGR